MPLRLGRKGRRHVQQRFLGDRHLLDYATLVTELVVGPAALGA